MKFTAKQIASFIGGEISGDENAEIFTFAKIEEGVPGAISFLANPKYAEYIYSTQSSVVLVNKDFEPKGEIKATLIKVDNAYESLAKLMMMYEAAKPKKQGISSLASIADSAKIGRNASTIALIQDKTPDEIEADGTECGNKKLTVVLNRNGMQMAPGEYIDLNFVGNKILYEQAKQHIPISPF
jgi:hypothetical protein